MYDPSKSNLSAAALEKFLKQPTTASIKEVPGIGKKSAEILEEEGIISIADILKKKKMLRDFYNYLRSKLKGVNRHRIFHALEEYENDDEGLLGENANPSLIEDLKEADKRCLIC